MTADIALAIVALVLAALAVALHFIPAKDIHSAPLLKAQTDVDEVWTWILDHLKGHAAPNAPVAAPPASNVTHEVNIGGSAMPVAPAPLPVGKVGVDAPPPLTYTDYPPALPCTLDANGVIRGGGLQLDQYGRLKSGFRQAEYLGENLKNKVGAMRAAFGNGGTIPQVATAAWLSDLNRLEIANGLGMAEASIAAAAACTGPTPQYYVTLATQTGAAMTPPVTA